MSTITADFGPSIQAHGIPVVKRPSTIYLAELTETTEVETDSGVMTGLAGGFVAYDPISGHVWPISREYVDTHYDAVQS